MKGCEVIGQDSSHYLGLTIHNKGSGSLSWGDSHTMSSL